MARSSGLSGLSWIKLANGIWFAVSNDDVFGQAAQLSYYFLLALFPALLFIISLFGYLSGENSELRTGLLQYLTAVLPGDVSQLVTRTIDDVTQRSGGGKLSFGILATLWAASSGMGAIFKSLNIAYQVKETRPWWKVRLVAIGLTLVLVCLIVSALVLVLSGHNIADSVAVKLGLGNVFALTWKVVQWPIVFVFVLLAFAIIYYFAPDVYEPTWKWITPGAMVGIVLWLLVSFGFRTYLHYFNSYSATYGSLGAVIILMLWFYFTGAAILLGGVINAEIEHAMATKGGPDAKDKGEKIPDNEGGR